MKNLISKLAILLSLLFIGNACSSDDPAPYFLSYPTENPMPSFLSSTGFNQKNLDIIDDASYEFGYKFKPLVKGKMKYIKVNLPDAQTNLRVTIWDVETQTVIRTETITSVTANIDTKLNITSLALTKDKEYMITFNCTDWHERSRDDAGNVVYPVTAGNISITGYGYIFGTSQAFPTTYRVNYIAGDLSFGFQPII